MFLKLTLPSLKTYPLLQIGASLKISNRMANSVYPDETFYITKTCRPSPRPPPPPFPQLSPTFYIVQLGFTRLNIIFLISVQKHRLWVLVHAVLTSTYNICFEQKYEKYQNFCPIAFRFRWWNFQYICFKRILFHRNHNTVIHTYNIH